jgi:hypothetical protein
MHTGFHLPVVAIKRNGQRVLINKKELDLTLHEAWSDESIDKKPELPVKQELVVEQTKSRDTLTRGKSAKK